MPGGRTREAGFFATWIIGLSNYPSNVKPKLAYATRVRIAIISFLVLAACGGSESDPHAIGACEGWTDNLGNPFTGMCEAACRTPPVATGTTCDTVVRLGCAAFDFEGSQGCCVEDSQTIRFYECQ